MFCIDCLEEETIDFDTVCNYSCNFNPSGYAVSVLTNNGSIAQSSNKHVKIRLCRNKLT